jgi:isoleucyl-tRNA synthetase
VIREVESCLDDISNWYVRISRRRFWREGHEADKRACYSSLLHALRSTALALAPILPFVTERIWQNAVRGLDANAPESIHHAAWPEVPQEWRNEALLRSTEAVRHVVSLGLKVRAQASVRIRMPLRAAYVVGAPLISDQLDQIRTELNVKAVEGRGDQSQFFRRTVKVDWKAANAHLKRDSGRFRAFFEGLDLDTRDSLLSQMDAGESVSINGWDQGLPAAIFREERELYSRYRVAEENGLLVALDLEVTPELKREGLMRDLVRNLQVMRKDVGLSVSQRIELGLHTDSPILQEAVCEYRDYIQDELLATRLEQGILEPANARQEIVIEGETVLATMRW